MNMHYLNKGKLWLLAVAFCAGLIRACMAADVPDIERPTLLNALITTPSSNLQAKASDISTRYPVETRLLTLDLIVYRWANTLYGMDPGINNLDQIASSLASICTDPAVGWAAVNMGNPAWTTKAGTPSAVEQRIQLLTNIKENLNAVVNQTEGMTQKPVDNLRSCAEMLSSMGLDLSYAFVVNRLAEYEFYTTHQYRAAQDDYDRAHPKFAAYQLRTQVAQIFNDLGLLQSNAGRYNDANQSYRASAKEWKAIGRGDLAGQQFVKAGFALSAAGQMNEAEIAITSGLETARGYAFSSKSYAPYARLLLDVATFYINKSMLDNAAKYLTDAFSNAELAKDLLLQSMVLKSQAEVSKGQGNVKKSRDYSLKREDLLTKLIKDGVSAKDRLSDASLPASELAVVLQAAEYGAEACGELGKYDQGIEILKVLIEKYSVLKQNSAKVNALRRIASQYSALNNYTEAQRARGQAAELAKRIGEIPVVIDILRDMEQSARSADNNLDAKDALQEAVDLCQASGDNLTLASILEDRGTFFDSLGQTQNAIDDLRSAAAIYASELDEPWSQARVHLKLANIQSTIGKTGDAVVSLSNAISRIEAWAINKKIDPNSEPKQADMFFNLYLQVVMLEASQGQKAAAIEQLKKARPYIWYPRLRSLLVASGDSVIAGIIKEVDKSEIPANTSPVSGTVRKIAHGWTAVLSQATQFSRIARGGRSLNKVASVDASEIFAIRNNLPNNLAIVEYVISDNTAYALIATRNSASCWELPVSGKQISDNLESLRKALSELEGKITAGNRVAPVKDWNSSELQPVMGPLREIDRMLMAPIESDISLLTPKVTSLVFILPDELAGLPFHALPRSSQDKTRFLIQDYAVSYLAPGMLGSLVRPKNTSLLAGKCKVAVFADSTGTLRGAKSEANTIKNIYKNNCNLYSGSNITKNQFVNASTLSNVIHVAAHHKLDPNPLQFSLVLAGKPGGTGTVQLSDLMRIRNNNLELAVLAACESLSTADMGLAGAPFTAEIFSLAGFPSVIGGLWKVSDEASSALMIDFYKRLSSLGQKGISLQRAQVFMIESKDGKFAHPFYWASFALYGDSR